MNNQDLQDLVQRVLAEVMAGQKQNTTVEAPAPAPSNGGTKGRMIGRNPSTVVEPGEVPDLSAVDYKQRIDIPNPMYPERLAAMRANTVARVGVWRAGPRLRTNTFLRFRADHAKAMDAVFTDVSPEVIEQLGLPAFKTVCDSKDMFLTRPDLGCLFAPETIDEIKKTCTNSPDVQIIVADGLSSTSIERNVANTLPAIVQGVKALGHNVGTPIFVKYGRVRSMDHITAALNAKVTVILIGERPGLATGESMSAYMTYKGEVGMPEKNRTVVSNIHQGGTNAVEAGAFIAEVCDRMMKEKVSGLDLKL